MLRDQLVIASPFKNRLGEFRITWAALALWDCYRMCLEALTQPVENRDISGLHQTIPLIWEGWWLAQAHHGQRAMAEGPWLRRFPLSRIVRIETIRHALEHGRSPNLPKSEPGIIFLKLPQTWLETRELRQGLREVVRDFLHTTERIANVVLYTSLV